MDKWRAQRHLDRARLYGGEEYAGLSFDRYHRVSTPRTIRARITWNVIKSVIDTLTAKLIKAVPRPRVITDDGSWAMQRQAKQLTKFTDGLLEELGVKEEGRIYIRDSAIQGTACYKVFTERKKVCGERTFVWELFVDPRESMYGKPRTLFQRKSFDRAVLLEQYAGSSSPKKGRDERRRAVESGRSPEEYVRVTTPASGLSDQVEVVEAWHLPSGPDAGDGRHVICTSAGTLFDEPWERKSFPFAFLRWDAPQIGFWGGSLVDVISGVQLEVNLTLRRVQEAINLHGKPWFFIPRGAAVNKSHLDDRLDTMIEYSGPTPPSIHVFQLLPIEVQGYLQEQYNKAFELAGVTQMSATGLKPAGLDAGVALREYNDIESERFLPQGKAIEQFVVDIAELAIEEARTIPGYEVRYTGGGGAEVLKFADVNLERDKYQMATYPVSSLPQNPALRMQRVQELVESGMIPVEEGMRLLDYPDLESYTDSRFAGFDLVDKIVERILDTGEELVPEPFLPVEYAAKHSHEQYLRATLMEEPPPPEHLEALRIFIEQAEKLAAEAAAAAAPPPGPPGGALPMPGGPPLPGGPPGAPPLPGGPPGLPPGV